MQILSGRRHRVRELAFSHCGRWLAAAGNYAGGVHVWDTANPTARPRHPGNGPLFWAAMLTFRPDGRLFFVARQNEWYLFDPATDELIEHKRSRVQGRVFPSPDGRRGVRADSHLALQSWTIPAEGNPAREWTVKDSAPRYVTAAFTADGTALATVENRKGRWCVAVRDAATGEARAELATPGAHVARLAFSADGAYLFGWWAGSLACWTVAEPDAKPRKAVNPTRKHFVSMAVHPSGSLLTADNDRLVRVWDVPALKPDRAIEWSIGKLYAVAVSPDGTRAAVGSHTGKVLVWDWD